MYTIRLQFVTGKTCQSKFFILSNLFEFRLSQLSPIPNTHPLSKNRKIQTWQVTNETVAGAARVLMRGPLRMIGGGRGCRPRAPVSFLWQRRPTRHLWPTPTTHTLTYQTTHAHTCKEHIGSYELRARKMCVFIVLQFIAFLLAPALGIVGVEDKIGDVFIRSFFFFFAELFQTEFHLA